VWTASASLVNIGVLHVRQLIDNVFRPCASPLYVILKRELQILKKVHTNITLFRYATD
jgi:hypothetical protein